MALDLNFVRHRVFSFLPAKELARQRVVSSVWRDEMAEHLSARGNGLYDVMIDALVESLVEVFEILCEPMGTTNIYSFKAIFTIGEHQMHIYKHNYAYMDIPMNLLYFGTAIRSITMETLDVARIRPIVKRVLMAAIPHIPPSDTLVETMAALEAVMNGIVSHGYVSFIIRTPAGKYYICEHNVSRNELPEMLSFSMPNDEEMSITLHNAIKRALRQFSIII